MTRQQNAAVVPFFLRVWRRPLLPCKTHKREKRVLAASQGRVVVVLVRALLVVWWCVSLPAPAEEGDGGCGSEAARPAVTARPASWKFQIGIINVNMLTAVKAGNVIERKGRLFEVVSAHHAQQGRGSANVQVELRDVLDGSKFTERLRPSESVERIRLEEQQRTYLYHEGDAVHVMHPDTFEQVALPRSMFGEAAAFLQEGMPVTVSIHDEDVVQASVPPQVTCTVRETDPYAKGQTAKPSYKPAVLTNGLTVQVPAFIGVGDQVVIDTRDQSFARRHKDES
eukprot:jgi/Chlat1/4936/Chrsp31S04855